VQSRRGATDLMESKRSMTPRAELAKLRQKRVEEDWEVQAQIMDAMLQLCGESGYRQVTVEDVYRRSGSYRTQFYRHFENKSDCYIAAYERESGLLAERLLSFADQRAEQAPLRQALEALANFLEEDPVRAKALFVEVHVAGGSVLRKREEFLERLSHALDSACREKKSRHSAPPITAEFMINVVDQAVSSALGRGDVHEFAEAVPDLAALICRAYRGDAG
jgi:AcrR family transcriptional regulator